MRLDSIALQVAARTEHDAIHALRIRMDRSTESILGRPRTKHAGGQFQENSDANVCEEQNQGKRTQIAIGHLPANAQHAQAGKQQDHGPFGSHGEVGSPP